MQPRTLSCLISDEPLRGTSAGVSAQRLTRFITVRPRDAVLSWFNLRGTSEHCPIWAVGFEGIGGRTSQA